MPDMSMSGKLPAGENNGLPAMIAKLLAEPKKGHLVIGLMNVSKITTNADTGDSVPTLRWLTIEPVDADEDVKILERLLRRLFERRTGKTQLPFDLEESIDEIEREMNGADHTDGESAA